MTVLDEIQKERERQHELWGEQNHPDGTSEEYRDHSDRVKLDCDLITKKGGLTWHHILVEEACEVFAETDPQKLRAELVQVAAVAVAWVESIDRRNEK